MLAAQWQLNVHAGLRRRWLCGAMAESVKFRRMIHLCIMMLFKVAIRIRKYERPISNSRFSGSD
jgi:hypothetical protein